MQVFCRIVELGTLSAVAREMNLSSMMISKYVAQLEKSLGVTLLNRTTRSLNVTEAGETYYNRSKQLLEDLLELDESTSQFGGTAKGYLKINAPIDFGGIYLVSAIEAYQSLYPEVKISLSLDNKPVNLRNGQFDIVILVTDTLDSGVVAKKIAQTELCAYASPQYIRAMGCPHTIEDLSLHRCLFYTNTPHDQHWIFNVNGSMESVKIEWLFASNNGRALCESAALGMGIIQVPKLTANQFVETEQLVAILKKYRIAPLNIYATYLKRRFYPAKLSTFIDFLTTYIGNKI